MNEPSAQQSQNFTEHFVSIQYYCSLPLNSFAHHFKARFRKCVVLFKASKHHALGHKAFEQERRPQTKSSNKKSRFRHFQKRFLRRSLDQTVFWLEQKNARTCKNFSQDIQASKYFFSYGQRDIQSHGIHQQRRWATKISLFSASKERCRLRPLSSFHVYAPNK